jgi:hypothetical protein
MQKCDEMSPRAEVLCRVPLSKWVPASTAPRQDAPWGLAIPKPDGFTLCLMLYEPLHHANYLVERDLRWAPPERLGPRLTTAGASILPESVQYSPDGRRIAYVRDGGETGRELWVVASGGNQVNGIPLAIGALGDAAAFSPDGAQLAIDVRPADGKWPELRIVNTEDSAGMTDLGPGQVGKEAWHPSGQYVVVTAPCTGTDGTQVWAVETAAPHRRIRLTQLKQGVEVGAAVSRDGRWAAAVVSDPAWPTVVFIDLNTLVSEAFA